MNYYKHNKVEYRNYIKKYPPTHNQNVRVIETLLRKFRRLRFKKGVFEIGCGYCFMAKDIMEGFKPKRYMAIDLSIDQIEEAVRYLGRRGYGWPPLIFRQGDIIHYTESAKYELVFCSTVLSHIPPQYIEKAVKNMCVLSKRHIVIVEPTVEVIARLRRNDDQWLHDYKKLFGEHKWRIKDIERIGGYPLQYIRFGKVK